MCNTPKFSIIIPVYNVAPYLRECLDSVLAQTFTDWEAICVDDGSSDGSGSILDEYKVRDNRFRVIHQKNAGVCSARNVGLKMATGRWICFVDADDVIASGWIAEAYRLFSETNVDSVRMSLSEVDAIKGVENQKFDRAYYVVRGRKSVDEWGWREFPMQGHVVRVFRENALAKSVPFPQGVKLAEDALRNLALVSKSGAICQSRYAGYFYRRHGTSATSQSLSATERICFMKFCLCIAPCRELMPYYAKFVWANLVAWVNKSKGDCKDDASELHYQFKHLVRSVDMKIKQIKFQWRISYLLYLTFGWLWPIHMTYGLEILAIKGLAHPFRRRKQSGRPGEQTGRSEYAKFCN